jgi:hypothetical protein
MLEMEEKEMWEEEGEFEYNGGNSNKRKEKKYEENNEGF